MISVGSGPIARTKDDSSIDNGKPGAQRKVHSQTSSCQTSECTYKHVKSITIIKINLVNLPVQEDPGITIDHFTFVYVVTWPLNGGDLVLIQTSLLFLRCCVTKLDLTRWHLNEKSREVYITARSAPASLTIMVRQLSTQL